MREICPNCHSAKRTWGKGWRYNKSGKKQMWWCNSCKRRFTIDDGFWKMKHKPELIAEAISCKKRGMPYNQVSEHFKEYDKAKICPATVYNWVKKYGKTLRNFNMKQIPKLSGKINIDEFVSKIKKRNSTGG